MDKFATWLEQSWIYIAGLAGILVTLKSLTTSIKEIKNKLEAPIDNLGTKVDCMSKKLDGHIKESEIRDAKQVRSRILRFADEIIVSQEHTKEHYENILDAIDEYEKYCREHPEFPNNKCLCAIQTIKEAYMERCSNNSFVTIERLVQNTKKD